MARSMGAILVCSTQPLVYYTGHGSAAYAQRARALTPQARPNIVKAKSRRAKSAGPRSAGRAKILGYSAPKLVQSTAQRESEFQMHQFSGSEVLMRQLSGSEFPMRQISGSEFPVRQLSGSDFPMRQLSGSEFPIRQTSGLNRVAVTVQRAAPPIVSPRPPRPDRRDADTVQPFIDDNLACQFVAPVADTSPPLVSPRYDRLQAGTVQPITVDNPASWAGSWAKMASGQVGAKLISSERDVEDLNNLSANFNTADVNDEDNSCFEASQDVVNSVRQFSAKLASLEEKIGDAIKAPAHVDDADYDDQVKPCFQASPLVENAKRQFSSKFAILEDKIVDGIWDPTHIDDDDFGDMVKPCFQASPLVVNPGRQCSPKLASPEGDLEDAIKPLVPLDPFLKTYSAMVRKRISDLDFVRLGLDFLLDTREQLEQIKIEDQEWYENEVKPFLTEAFKLHDKRGAEVLNEAESYSFYSSLIADDSEVSAAFASIAMSHSIKAQLFMMLSMIPQEFWEGYQEKQSTYERVIQESIQQAVDAAKHDATSRMEIYRKLKDEHDAAAFKVLDANGDGSISLEEFLAVFNPNSSRQTDFMVALGFITVKEKVQYQQVMLMQREALFAGR